MSLDAELVHLLTLRGEPTESAGQRLSVGSTGTVSFLSGELNA